MPGGEKTEKATPKKRRDAREKEGSTLQSKEVTTAVSLLGIFIALNLIANFMLVQLRESLTYWLNRMGTGLTVNSEFFTQNAITIIKTCALVIGPILGFALIFAIIPVIAQTKGLFTMKPLKPNFGKLNPITGMKRLFSLQSLINIVKGIIEIAAIAFVVYNEIIGLIPQIKKLPDMDLIQGVLFTANSMFSIMMTIAIIFIFVAAADYLYQWWEFERKLKMTKQEVKDEYKQTEGDPQIKSKIKQKQREVAQRRMMEEIPTADVVVRNPTHLAIALKYDTSSFAPMVVAKGADNIAQKIVDIAAENDVRCIENKPLARALYDTVKLGSYVPPELFTAVAALYAELEKFRTFAEEAEAKDRGSGTRNPGFT